MAALTSTTQISNPFEINSKIKIATLKSFTGVNNTTFANAIAEIITQKEKTVRIRDILKAVEEVELLGDYENFCDRKNERFRTWRSLKLFLTQLGEEEWLDHFYFNSELAQLWKHDAIIKPLTWVGNGFQLTRNCNEKNPAIFAGIMYCLENKKTGYTVRQMYKKINQYNEWLKQPNLG